MVHEGEAEEIEEKEEDNGKSFSVSVLRCSAVETRLLQGRTAVGKPIFCYITVFHFD